MSEEAKRIVLSPFARVEGDLRVEVTVADGAVTEAHVSGTLYRGFERMLRGRGPLDGMVLTPRVCGQCSLSHTAAAAAALRSLARPDVPVNGRLSWNLMLGTETLLNHLHHFYLAFAPDLALPNEHHPPLERFASMTGPAFVRGVAARRTLLPLLGIFAGKWPNSLAAQPGGSTRPVDAGDLVRATGILREFLDFLEGPFLGDRLERWLELDSDRALRDWAGRSGPAESDLGVFVVAALERGLDRLGRGPGTFLSSGGWETGPGRPWLRAGFHDGKEVVPFELAPVTEQVKHSFFDPAGAGVHPSRGRTEPTPGRPGAYSWAKAPRWNGRPAETGPLARLLCDGDPLIADVVARRGPGVYARMLARLRETVRLARALGEWLDGIDPAGPFCVRTEIPADGQGVGVLEAPRGMLGHWLRLEAGRIAEYQIVTPTSWNFSPRDDADVPGPAEHALVGTPAGPGHPPLPLLHVVRSFDPCLYCSVH